WDWCEGVLRLGAPYRSAWSVGCSVPTPRSTGSVRRWGGRGPITALGVRCSTTTVTWSARDRQSKPLRAGRLPRRADVRLPEAWLPVFLPPGRPGNARTLAMPLAVVRPPGVARPLGARLAARP